MLPRKYSYHYSRNLKLAVIASLTAVIFMFKFMPRISVQKELSFEKNNINFINEIPATFQQEQSGGSLPPKPSEPAVIVEGEMAESPYLQDIDTGTARETGRTVSEISGKEGGSGINIPFVPRQILEVVPVKPDNDISGTIKLSLKIGTDGKVTGYKIIVNTTGCPECLKNVIAAALKSKWQPATRDGKKVEYWIEKSYGFN